MASSGVMVCGRTPMSPRRTRPDLRICSYTVRAMLLGAAKPSPSAPLARAATSVLMPTTRPARSTSGPPLLPGLIEASVCT